MAYEVFTRRVTRAGTPAISISKLGRIGVNQHAAKAFKDNAVEFVLLLWDQHAGKMAIRPITKKDTRAYALTYDKAGNGSGAGFSAKTFFDFIKYDYSDTRSYNATWNETEGILEIELPAERVHGSNQAKLVSVGNKRR